MHARRHIREFFETLIQEDFFQAEGRDLEDVAGISDDSAREILNVRRLLGLLWHSTDQLPADLRKHLKDDMGWDEEARTYGQAAQRIRQQLEEAQL